MRPVVRLLFCAVTAGIMLGAGPVTTTPTSRPTSKPASRPTAEIDPAAKPLLERLRNAYRGRSMAVAARITGEFDVAGRSRTYTLDIKGITDGAGRFAHFVKDVGQVSQDKEKLTVYDARRDSFGTAKMPAALHAAADLPEAAIDILLDENPAMLLAISSQPDNTILIGAKRVNGHADELIVHAADSDRIYTLSSEGTIRKVVIDFTPEFKSRGVGALKSAKISIEYEKTEFDVPFSDDTFSFKPPVSATEFQLVEERPTTGPKARRTPTSRSVIRPATSD